MGRCQRPETSRAPSRAIAPCVVCDPLRLSVLRLWQPVTVDATGWRRRMPWVRKIASPRPRPTFSGGANGSRPRQHALTYASSPAADRQRRLTDTYCDFSKQTQQQTRRVDEDGAGRVAGPPSPYPG